MKTKFGKGIVSGLALAFAICVAASANAATLYVSNTGSCGGNPIYSPTIQAAVNASVLNGVVKVCPGIYQEQVTINKSLTLEGFTVGTGNQAVITAPNGLSPYFGFLNMTTSLTSSNQIAAQILVQDAAKVNISDVVVDGSTNNISTCKPELIGIYYQNSSGVINHVVTRHQDGAFSGCESGYGIFAQSGDDVAFPAGGTSVVAVDNSNVHDFDFAGITGNEAGTKLTVLGNLVRGTILPLPTRGCQNAGQTYSPTNTPDLSCGSPQIGIQIGFQATGAITGNTVIDLLWPDTNSEASGMQAYDASGITMSTNHVGSTQYGISAVADGSGIADNEVISSNVVDGTQVLDGIDVCGSNGSTVKLNTVRNSKQSAIHLDASCTSAVASQGGTTTVSGNIINEACVAVLNNTGTSNTNTDLAVNTNNVVYTTLTGTDTFTCVHPSGGDVAVPALTAGSGQKKPHGARP